MVRHGPFAASILVLSEDSSPDTLRAVRALASKILRLIDPHYARDKIDLEPEDERAQEAMWANRWQLGKKPKPENHRANVALTRSIATKIMEPSGFVFFHTDADRCWKDREKDPSLNIQRVNEQILERVRILVREHLAKAPRGDDEAAILSRFCLLSPYYSIEAWLYQNTNAAIELCRKHHGGQHVSRFSDWAANRAALDDEHKPKDSTCLGSDFNRTLAESGFPAAEVYDVGASFCESVDRVMACAALCAALASSRPRYH